MKPSSIVLKQDFQFVIRPSRIQGRGLFAAQKIPDGERVIEYTGQKLTRREGARRERFYNSIGYSLLFDLDDCYLDGLIGGNESIYINHSLRPNLEARVRKGGVWFHSLRAIRKGEELTFDYGFDPVKPKPR